MQQMIRPATGPIHAYLKMPGSKSIAHRAILIASLADGISEITGLVIDEEVKTFTNALNQLGIITQPDEALGSLIIAGGNGKYPKKQANLWCGKVDTIARFLVAACASTPGVYYFDGSSSLRKRSVAPLLKTLSLQGVQFIPGDARKMPFTLIGADSLEGGEVLLNDATLSQIISALLMIAPYARSPFSFSFHHLSNKSKIDMTYAMMAEFGVLVHRIHHGQFMVPVPQRYHAREYLVEADLALASYFFAAAALTGGEMTIQPTNRMQSKQPEVQFLSILEKMGCRVADTPNGLSVQGPAQLQGVEVTLNEFSDQFLILAALAPFAKTPTRLNHTGSLKRKESDRLFAIKTELTKLGVPVNAGKTWLEIAPHMPNTNVVSAHQNHRVGMALAIMGLKIPNFVIEQAQDVLKNFPNFFKLWDKLVQEPTNINA